MRTMRAASTAKPAAAEPWTEASAAFEAFVRDAEPRLRRALVAAYGFEKAGMPRLTSE
jgi:hypothetical protein